MSDRKPFLDNIRWATVLLVLFYHVGYIFNGVGILGGVPDAESLAWVDTLLSVVYPWFMVLLFVVSGICARYALEKRGGKRFLRERARKLLVPSTLGLFVIHWITGYFNIKMGGALDLIPAFLIYPISVISGIGPLWFIQMLFLFSAALVLIRKLDKNNRLWTFCGKANGAAVAALVIVIWGAAQVGNLPVLTTYRFGIYFAAFLIGYLVLSHEKVLAEVERLRIPAAVLALVCAVKYAVTCYGENYTADAVLRSFGTNVYLWLAVLAVLGMAKRYANRETALTRYLARNSFGFYIVHYPVLIVTCYFLQYHTGLSAGWKYLLALLAELAGTFLFNELIKRLPVIRYLVLGQKR